jgi:hypothetical protein
MTGKSCEDLSVWVNLGIVDLGMAWLELLVLVQLIIFESIWTSNKNEFRLMWVVSDLEVEVCLFTFDFRRDLWWDTREADVDLGSNLDLVPIPHKK